MAAANITPTAMTNGIIYGSSVPLTPTEAALGDATQTTTTVPVVYGQEIVAVVQLSVSGIITGNSTFIFLQTNLNGVWVDVAWCFWNGKQGNATFVLCAGGKGNQNNAFQFSRQSSSAPSAQANGSNQCPLGGSIRFTGFTNMIGGSSNVAGTPTQVSATITFKLTTPR